MINFEEYFQMIINTQILTGLSDAFNKVVLKLNSWLETAITMLPNFVLAIIIILVFSILARFSRKALYHPLNRVSKNRSVNDLILSTVNVTLVIFGLFVALSVLNLEKTVTSLLAGVGIAGLAAGFAFKDAAANFLAGIYMAIKSPINEGDLIEFAEYYGHVEKIGLRATRMRTLQGQHVIIPNRLIIEDPYTHYTVDPFRRIDLAVGISYGDDLEKAEKITLEAIKKIESVLQERPVDLYYTEFGSSSINFVVRYWVYFRRETDYLSALSQGIKNIKKAYDENGITITFPIRTLDFGIKGGKTLADMVREIKSESGNSHNGGGVFE